MTWDPNPPTEPPVDDQARFRPPADAGTPTVEQSVPAGRRPSPGTEPGLAGGRTDHRRQRAAPTPTPASGAAAGAFVCWVPGARHPPAGPRPAAAPAPPVSPGWSSAAPRPRHRRCRRRSPPVRATPASRWSAPSCSPAALVGSGFGVRALTEDQVATTVVRPAATVATVPSPSADPNAEPLARRRRVAVAVRRADRGDQRARFRCGLRRPGPHPHQRPRRRQRHDRLRAHVRRPSPPGHRPRQHRYRHRRREGGRAQPARRHPSPTTPPSAGQRRGRPVRSTRSPGHRLDRLRGSPTRSNNHRASS